MVVHAPDLGGCLCCDCLGPGLLRSGRLGGTMRGKIMKHFTVAIIALLIPATALAGRVQEGQT